MTTAATTLLGLALPVTGELSGTWGDTVNNSITNLLDTAVAGTTTLSTDVDVTLTTTTLASNQARQAILLCSGARTALRTITAPAQSKIYTIINATTGGFSVKLVGVGPTTGVTIVAGESALVAWNGSDFIKISNTAGAGVFSSITNTGLTSGRVVYSTTGGLETDSANLTFNGTTLTANTLNLTNALGTSYGGTGLTSFTANGVVYASSTSALATGSALTFDGTNFATTGKIGAGGNPGTYTQIWSSGNVMAADGSQIGFLANSAGAPANYMTGSNTSNYLAWIANNSEQMRLTSTGLGVGTSSPGYKLDVQAATAVAQVKSTTGTNASYYVANNTGGDFYIGRENSAGTTFGTTAYSAVLWSAGAYPMVFFTNGNERMRIDSSGNLGIGTTSPGAKLDVNGTIYSRTGGIYTDTVTAYSGSSISINAGSSNFNVVVNGSERARIDSSGNLGLGVTPSAWGSSWRAFTVGSTQASFAGTAGQPEIWQNAYQSATQSTYVGTGTALRFSLGSDGVYRWYQAGSGTAGNAISFTQAMTLDTSGQLGIGTTSPTTKLYVEGTVSARSGSTGIQIYGTGGSGEINSVGSNPLIFNVNSTERARIDSSGNLLVGQTAAGAANSNSICINGPSSGGSVVINHANGSASGSGYEYYVYNASVIGSITQSGTTAVLYNVTSDQRLKENIADADSASALIDSLQVRKFDWKADGNHQRYGFVAQELVTVAPEAVHQPADPEEMMAVDYSKLVPMLVKEIQSLRKRLADAGIA